VAGAKSLKLKAKAKVVKGNLKNIKVKTKEKVVEVDKALNELQEKIRASSKGVKKTVELNKSVLPSSTENENTEKCSEEAVDKLETMQL